MPISLEKFVQQLEESGVLASDTLQNFLPPKASPQNAEELGRELIRQKKLTKFQVEEIYRGKGKSLTLGNYVLMEKIGAGGMGQVFKARHRRMDRFVAVKLLPPAMTKDKAAIARFEREVKAAAKLRHPNIVAADDADCANGVHFLVMELVDGTDLAELVRKNGPFPVEMAVNYIQQAARGLEAAHNEGIVHRDIKPANLLLDKKGTVKILDMGLARLNGDDAAGQAELTGTGMVMGTVDYMAPEQALSTKHADSRADIYALGCSLYYLLTGQATYGGETLMAKLLAHRDGLIPSLRATRPDIPEQVQAVFQKMVAKAVQDRYQTMTDVIAALEHCDPRTASSANTLQTQLPSGNTQQTQTSFAGSGMTDFLKGFPSLQEPAPTIAAKARAKPVAVDGNRRKLLIGGGILGALSLLIVVVVMVNGSSSKTPVPKGERNGKVVRKAKPRAPGDNPAAELQPGQLAVEAPGIDEWVKGVAALLAEQQVTAVSKKLVELNPGFDGKVTGWGAGSPLITDGVVSEIGFATEHVSDISPVRALSGLRRLNCNGGNNIGKLSDLRPLQGMQLVTLSLEGTQVADLTPLTGMPLVTLSLLGTQVADLTPLTGMQLVTLSLQGTQVADLTPLTGMPLDFLTCWGSPIRSLSPLKNVPLTQLTVSSLVDTDLSPLAGMKLISLSLTEPKIKDISVLEGMPLINLVIVQTGVSDLSPLQGMPLESLQCNHTPVSDLSPLQGLKLKTLALTPENITAGIDMIHQMKSIESISADGGALIPAADFWKKYEAGDFDKGIKTFKSPAFQQWMKDVAALPAEQQVAAVRNKLVELNPEFDGTLSNPWNASLPPTPVDGKIVELTIDTDKVTDLSPLRAFPELSVLACSAKKNPARQLDLSPLRGTKVTSLRCSQELVDYSTLRGLKLTTFACYGPGNTNLTPLSGLPLQNLALSGNWFVENLQPLKRMPLTVFSCDNCLVADLSPLRGMQLTILACQSTQVTDLLPLKGMPLEVLSCEKTLITDLSPLAGMKLKKLSFTPKPELRGLQAIRHMDSLVEIGPSQGELMPRSEFWRKFDAGEFK
ncbi:MAG: stkP 3 [Planctomycetaceae bacterium]|nr:stkP 3 [Planctomycetaceae bacterium]